MRRRSKRFSQAGRSDPVRLATLRPPVEGHHGSSTGPASTGLPCEIASRHHVTRCARCDAELPPSGRYCPACGHAVSDSLSHLLTEMGASPKPVPPKPPSSVGRLVSSGSLDLGAFPPGAMLGERYRTSSVSSAAAAWARSTAPTTSSSARPSRSSSFRRRSRATRRSSRDRHDVPIATRLRPGGPANPLCDDGSVLRDVVSVYRRAHCVRG